jgi:hypothetical protein
MCGFHTVKAILPDKATGLDVGVAAGFGVPVGSGVEVGPLLVGTALGVRVGVLDAATDVGVNLELVTAVAVLSTMGVQVGVGPELAAATTVELAGITRT